MGLSALDKRTVFYSWIKDRIDKNKNVILVINGETGSGKTYAALKIAEDLSKIFGNDFSVKGNMDFNFGELLQKIEDGGKKPGAVYLFEEVGSMGSGAGSKQWQSKANQMFSSFGQTSRHLRQVFIMTCPLFSNLQADTRKLCHLQIEMRGINHQNKLSYSRPFRIQVNQTSGKLYMKYLRFKKNNHGFKLKRLDMDLPSKETTEIYETAKHIFTAKLNKDIIEQSKPKKKELTVRQEEAMTLWNEGNDMNQIAKKMGISQRVAYDHRAAILKKGYELIKHTTSMEKPIQVGELRGVEVSKPHFDLTFQMPEKRKKG